VHSSISKNKYINNILGGLSHYWLGPTANWYGFKYNHMMHHRHTNVSELDPDYWSSLNGPGGPKFVGIRWATMDIPYWINSLKHFYKKDYICKIKVLIYQIPIISLLISSIYYGFFTNLLLFWIIPARITLIILAYTFDFLPHYPHDSHIHEDRYKTTSYLSVPWYVRPIFTFLTFYQNYHVIHHLYPSVPFYKYKKMWDLKNEHLITDKKIPIQKILPYIFGEEDIPAASLAD